ncbi:hypothetical protein DXG01_003683 [Tephrocybe rancida]|nr:hypothetical protein DXG01_003683 [Tephrocybe rancida]
MAYLYVNYSGNFYAMQAYTNIYGYRDLLPLSTYTELPLDISEGWILWTKIGLLALSGLVVPVSMPRHHEKLAKTSQFSNSEETASWFSLITYSHLDPLVFLGFRERHLSFGQLPPLADYDRASDMHSKASLYIDDPTRHLFWRLFRNFGREYFVQAISLIIYVFTGFVSPYAVKELLHHLETKGDGAHYQPWLWIFLLFAGPATALLAFQWYTYFSSYTRVHMEAIVTQLVFTHSLRIRLKAEAAPMPDVGITISKSDADAKPKTQNVVGKINNLISTDLGNIVDGCDFLLLFIYIPLQITLCVIFLYGILGWSAFVGFGVLLLTSPAPGYVAKLIRDVQIIRLQKTDARVQTVTEKRFKTELLVMSVLRMVKLFGWEKKVIDNTAKQREEELVTVRQRQLLELISGNIQYADFPLVCLYPPEPTTQLFDAADHNDGHLYHLTVVMKQELNASKVFSSMSVFDMLRSQLRMTNTTTNLVVAAKVSLDRVHDFLHSTELLDIFSDNSLPSQGFVDMDLNEVLGFNDAVFSWTTRDNISPIPDRNFLLKISGELTFRRGQLNLIVGPTGSGKTSVLMALLGELHYQPNGEHSWYNLPRESCVAYAAQESWVQSATIRNSQITQDNIVFGSEYDATRYEKVLHQCGLDHDLGLFPAGDQTEVGERGLTLSGGQKARITLARAVYSQAAILLLDDILAALDVHTSQWVITKCLGGDLLKGRTVLLVTHNIAMIHDVGFVVSVDSAGNVSSQDYTPAHYLEADTHTIDRDIMRGPASVGEALPAPTVASAGPISDGRLTAPESVERGRVNWKALQLYFSALGGSHPFVFFMVSVGGLTLSEASNTIQTWYLGYWASQYEDHPPSEVRVGYHISVYAGLLLFAVTMYCTALVVHILGTLRASRSIHSDLITSVLGATLRWLDITPTSRLIARCTQDIRAGTVSSYSAAKYPLTARSTVDGPVPNGIWRLYGKTIMVLLRFGAIVLMAPGFVGPSIIVAILGGLCGQMYLAAQLPVKRMMSNAKAPILGHFGAMLTGLTSIRAFGAQERFSDDVQRYIDGYTRPARTFYDLNRWLNVRIGCISSLFSACLAAYLVYFHTLSAGDTGFSLNMAGEFLSFVLWCSGGTYALRSSVMIVGFSTELLWFVRDLNEFEVQGWKLGLDVVQSETNVIYHSLERIQSYLEIEHEPKSTPKGVPPAYWPASGDLRVKHLSARYAPGGQSVLRNLSFHIKSGERIGIVGRTGSGKSSLTLSLLRCMLTEGEVYYDGIDTRTLNLDELRSKITIIPQIPELLSGTLRRNLDPFEEYDDATLNDALHAAGMTSLQKGTSGEGKLTLDSFIYGTGDNLSIGQRQILALARAMVRGGKLLILDEDYETDAVIQGSLRRELGKDVTLIVVAHRLQTIMDADKIVEFGSPLELLENQGGRLRSLVDASGDKEALYAMNSTDSWNSSNAADELHFEWKADQIRLLARTLDALPPQLVTPFNGPIPPSNLLDKIARGVSQAKGPLDWPHSLRATRVKLIELSRAKAKEERYHRTSNYSDVDMDEAIDPRYPDGTGKSTRARRPLYKQSSMDFISTADLGDDENIDILQTTERLITKSGFHPYAHPVTRSRLSSPSCSTNFSSRIGPSTPSSSTLNTLSSFSSANRILRRTSSNVSSTSASSVSMNGGVSCTDPRVQKIRRQESYYAPVPPPKDIRLAPSTHKENLEPSPLAGVKRAPSFGALAQEVRRDRHVFGGPLIKAEDSKDASAYPSSDEEEKIRAKGVKKMRVKDTGGLAPAASLNTGTPPDTPLSAASPKRTRTKVPASAPPCLSCKSLASPKSPTPKPKQRTIVPRDVPAIPENKSVLSERSATATAKELKKRPGAPMNLTRNPSIFGAELPPLPPSETLCPRLQAAPALSGRVGTSPEARVASPDVSPQRPKTLRRVQRIALGRRISFSSLVAPGEEADAEADDEDATGVRRERQRQRDLGQLGSAFQLH